MNDNRYNLESNCYANNIKISWTCKKNWA